MEETTQIQLPTPGRVVLYAPNTQLDASQVEHSDGRIEPPVGRWCYPPIVRETIDVPAYVSQS